MDDERASELAWQLAELDVGPGGPHIFEREARYREHLYYLLDQTTLDARWHRLKGAVVSGRLIEELRLQRLQCRIVELCGDEDAALVEVQEWIFAAGALAESSWLGAHVSIRTSAGLRAIDDAKMRDRFARLVRRGAVAEGGSAGLELTTAMPRRRAAYASSFGVCAWMLFVLLFMLRQGPLESQFVVAYLMGSASVAAWSARQMLLDIRADETALASARAGVGPRNIVSLARSGPDASSG